VSSPLLGRRQAEIELGTELTSSFVGKKSSSLDPFFAASDLVQIFLADLYRYSNPSIHFIAYLLAISVRACAKSSSFSCFWGSR
jgi:hypothetical protein